MPLRSARSSARSCCPARLQSATGSLRFSPPTVSRSCPVGGKHPIGTGPFKFVSYKPNESIRLTRNPDYWKPDRPYLDGIEWTIRSTALLAFVAGKVDMTFPYEVTGPMLKDIKQQAPEAICELRPRGVSSTLIVNRTRRRLIIPISAGRWR